MEAALQKNFESQINDFSLDDRIAAIELILASIKKSVAKDDKNDWLADTFEIMNENMVSSGGKMWKRDTLYSRGRQL